MIDLRQTNARLQNTFTLEPYAVKMANKIVLDYCHATKLFQSPNGYRNSMPTIHEMKMVHTGIGYSFTMTVNNKKKSYEDEIMTLFISDVEVIAYSLRIIEEKARQAQYSHY